MFSCVEKSENSFWGPVRNLFGRMRNKDEDSRNTSKNKNGGDDDPLMWCKDLEKHYCGDFSFATVQANQNMEDSSQVETGPNATFAGVYDGHGGSRASQYIRDHLFAHLMRYLKENGTMSEANLKNAFAATEDGFLSLVKMASREEPLVAAIGSCCLVGVIWNDKLYMANLGDSRAVKGYFGESNEIIAQQLTEDHNVSRTEVREELKSMHLDDSRIVYQRRGVWRIKGMIQVSRAIGDAYLKDPEYTLDRKCLRFHLSESILRPVLRADPSTYTIDLQPSDKFLIFASDGLWDQVTNQAAVEIVYNYPREGIARRLLESALREAARKSETTYDELKKYAKGIRRMYHDDITVIVIFVENELMEKKVDVPAMSVIGGVANIEPSMFNILQDTKPNRSEPDE
ncbi:hypothetical protein DCAR_0522629 [Daucus carota subsp. sativus]|uniref:protein-serine/threonine phosphatase n=1 Tax=Daucus carota subsp. sativus TaxID=79200 RepID=A0AAF1B3G1_DAUCS|nr:PREDICTED: probable protein phosphatase 2C 43 [Daucus carota subsp. sativus]WOH03233.1 hypothetical protein DCAR_0522629 [Daucus carota subsp. sativus]